MTPGRDPEAGVTLIEMLVAVAICALIGLAGFGMLDTILRVNDRAEGDLNRYADLDRAFLVLGRDLIAAEASALSLEDGILRLRAPDGRTLQYNLEDAALQRHVGASEVSQRLVSGVQGATWRVLDTSGAWRPDWQQGPPDAPRPRGVELHLDLSAPRAGSVRRLFRLTPGPAPSCDGPTTGAC